MPDDHVSGGVLSGTVGDFGPSKINKSEEKSNGLEQRIRTEDF